MGTKEQVLQAWQSVKDTFDLIKIEQPNWYASLRIPALELERRTKQFIKELPDGE